MKARQLYPVWGLLLAVLPRGISFAIEGRGRSATGRCDTTRCFASARLAATIDAATTTSHPTAERPSQATPDILKSVVRPRIHANPTVWKKFCPSAFEDALGSDVRVHWEKRDNTTEPSTRMAARLASSMVTQFISKPIRVSETQQLEASLSASLETFMTFCEHHLQPDRYMGYTTRLVATRGSASTKCPAWHQDHVPVRWIQSLVGPGCQWVDLDHWAAADDSDHTSETMQESVQDLNQRRVDPKIPIQQAAPGEAVLLVGRTWSEYCRPEENRNLPAVVHKSPSGLLPWQGRILLTMDVLTDENQ